MHEELEEGWFTDPFTRHEARWLSAGSPTKLVRDGDVEAYDEPPDTPPTSEPVRIETVPAATGGADLRRADDAELAGPYDEGKATMESLDAIGQVGMPNTERLLEGEEY